MAEVKRFRKACTSGPAACITAWDHPTAQLAERAGMDMILIGDSLAIVSAGLDSAKPFTLDEMIYHCKAVSRGAPNTFRIGDLPLGTYEVSPEQAIISALRLVKEGSVHGVKLEGGREMADQVKAITNAGIPVVGHIGLTPQRALAMLALDDEGVDVELDYSDKGKDSRLGFGSTVDSARLVFEDAKALEKAGAVAVLMEAVADEASTWVTKQLKVPTIGMGCGSGTSAQMVLQSEVLGYLDPKVQRWHKAYTDVGERSVNALKQFKEECRARVFPGKEHGYDMAEGQNMDDVFVRMS